MNSRTTTSAIDAAFCRPTEPATSIRELHPSPSSIRIAGDGYAYVSYLTQIVDVTLQRAATQHHTDETYDIWDQLWRHLGSSAATANFPAAIDDARALWAALGIPPPPVGEETNSVVIALLQGDRDGAAHILDIFGIDGFRRPCDRTTSTVTAFHILRVGANGAASDAIVKEWRGTSTVAFVPSPFYPFYQFQDTHAGPASVFVDEESTSMITDADRGAVFSWQARKDCEEDRAFFFSPYRHDVTQTDSSCISGPETHLTRMEGSNVASDVVWDQGGLTGPPVQLVLQLEDDSFVGASTENGDALLVFDASAQTKLLLPGYAPEMATAHGGLIARNGTTYYEFGADGAATGRNPSVPQFLSWGSNSYNVGTTLARVSSPVPRRGTSYAATIGGNSSANGTSIGILDIGDGVPAYAMQSAGPTCTLTPNSGPADLTGAPRQQYENKRQQLLVRPHLNYPAEAATSKCSDFFSAPGADPTRAGYFGELKNAVMRQQPYDGTHTTMSQYEAGLIPLEALQTPRAVTIAQTAAVCQKFVPSIVKGQYNTAAGQAVPRGTQIVPQDVYMNTDPKVFGKFTQGTLLHEVLHNLSGLDEEDLRKLLGAVDITAKLKQEQCVGSN